MVLTHICYEIISKYIYSLNLMKHDTSYLIDNQSYNKAINHNKAFIITNCNYYPLITITLWILSILYSSFNITYSFITLLLWNLVSYIFVLTNNFRNLFNYIVPSSILFVLIIYSIININIFNHICYIILYISLLAKLVLYPWIIYAFSVYRNIPLNNYWFITILSKLVYIIFTIYMLSLNINFIYYIANIIILSILCLYNNDLLLMLLYSSAIQIIYCLLAIYQEYYNLSIYYLLYYLYSLILLAFTLAYNWNSLLNKLVLFLIFYSYVALPPFIGFYLKLLILNSIATHFTLIYLFIIIICSIIVTYMYIFIYNNMIYSSNMYIYISSRFPIIISILFASLFVFILDYIIVL